MSRKPNRVRSVDTDINKLQRLSKGDEARIESMNAAELVMSLDPKLQLKTKLILLYAWAKEQQPKTTTPAKTGRPRDQRLERAADMYLSAIKQKDWLRGQGYESIHHDTQDLEAVAEIFFADEASTGDRKEYEKLLERIKYAIKARRKETGSTLPPLLTAAQKLEQRLNAAAADYETRIRQKEYFRGLGHPPMRTDRQDFEMVVAKHFPAEVAQGNPRTYGRILRQLEAKTSRETRPA